MTEHEVSRQEEKLFATLKWKWVEEEENQHEYREQKRSVCCYQC
jgi:hypothetical protein